MNMMKNPRVEIAGGRGQEVFPEHDSTLSLEGQDGVNYYFTVYYWMRMQGSVVDKEAPRVPVRI